MDSFQRMNPGTSLEEDLKSKENKLVKIEFRLGQKCMKK